MDTFTPKNNTFTPEQDPEDFGLENPEEESEEELENGDEFESEEGETEEDLSKVE
jgi:hypothetical protein